VRSREHGNEPSDPITCGQFLDQSSDYGLMFSNRLSSMKLVIVRKVKGSWGEGVLLETATKQV
jgi:hypothetical protein